LRTRAAISVRSVTRWPRLGRVGIVGRRARERERHHAQPLLDAPHVATLADELLDLRLQLLEQPVRLVHREQRDPHAATPSLSLRTPS
jgi:hypothetical protein